VTTILGISAFYHDSAATLIIDGKIKCAAQEERFTRIKHDSNFPYNAIQFVLDYSNKKLSEIEAVIFYEKPFLKFERLLESYIAFAPKGFKQFSAAMPIWLKEKLFQKKQLIDALTEIGEKKFDSSKIFFSEHHMSHAASAFYPSPYNEAIILTADGVGEWATTTVAIGKKNKIDIKKEIHFPHSLGLLYSAFTYYIGFKVNSGEYKLMGLAPYGEPKFEDIIKKNLIDIKKDGSFRLNQKYFNYATGLTMINKKFEKLFGREIRNPNSDNLENFHMDIAASIQKVTEEIMITICKNLKQEYQIKNLCLAGGVALNCVANGKLVKEKIFDEIWIQPAAGDSGGSLGACFDYWYNKMENVRELKKESIDTMCGSYLGPEFSNSEIEEKLKESSAIYEKLENESLIKITAELLSKGNAIGWFQGRMEFGPRALGARSIIADPRSDQMQKNLNLKVKFRESFRPFAPSVLFEDVSEWFDLDQKSPYMLLVSKIKKNKIINMTPTEEMLFGIEKLNIKRSDIPAVTHVDYSSRVQTVHKDTNIMYYNLIKKFKELTGCPVLVNTSFNVRGEPIVNSPKDAFNCFMGTGLDYLIIGNFILDKKKQDNNLIQNYKNKFNPD
jgi:carbamoyltransferase